MTFDVDKWWNKHVLEEGAATAVERLEIKEIGQGQVGEAQAGGTRRHVTIIEAGWGSSGYYSREVLARDGPQTWPKGTHMYLNHPSRSEETERPERDLRDLVGTLATDPVMEGKKLVAEAEIYEHWAPPINAMAKDIGLSIRAVGEAEHGEAEGKHGPLIVTLDEGISVDYVTQAGAGGKLGMLIESARGAAQPVAEVELEEARNILDWLASKIHSHFTTLADDGFGQGYLTRDERIALSQAIGAALDAFNADVEDNAGHLADRDPFEMPDAEPVVATEVLRIEQALLAERDVSKGERVALAKKGQAIPVRNDDGEIVDGRFPMANCQDVKNAAQSIGRSSQSNSSLKAFITRVAGKLNCDKPFQSDEAATAAETNKEEPIMGDEAKQLSEAQNSIRQLEERMETLETEKGDEKTRADRAEDALLQERARRLVDEALEADPPDGEDALPQLPERAYKRVVEAALKDKLPVDEDGKLDEDQLASRARKAAREEAEYLGGTSGNGQVKGMGVSESAGANGGGEGSGETDAKTEEALAEHFQSTGMSEKAAKIAAKGR